MLTNHDSNIDEDGILVVDDETHNLKLLSDLLGRYGYRIRPANNPRLAIDSALAMPPKLILLDVRFPDMDGFEVCRRLKQDERTREVPVLFISAMQDIQDKIQGFDAGGVDFISKPFHEQEVLARIRTHMKLRNMQLHMEELVEKRSAELTLSETKYRGLVENALIGVFNSTIDGRLKFVNGALARMFDFDTPEQMIAQGAIERWGNKNDRKQMLAQIQKHGSVTNYETDSLTFTDRHIHVIFSAKQVGNDIIGMVMDITERKLAEEKLHVYQARLKALASQLTIAEEKERRAIAADLHDHVGHSLALARMQLDNILKSTSKIERSMLVNDVSNIMLQALQETRSLIFELSSPAMNEFGLSAAISEWLEEHISHRYGLETEFADNLADQQRKPLEENVRALLFRNVRELLTNVVKHARAKKVSVRLMDEVDSVKVIVEDDGVGFNPAEWETQNGGRAGFGLFSIKERMMDLGGSMQIQSKPGKGCRVVLNMPSEY